MLGVLAVSFCERNGNDAHVCLDLWTYPDGTYNLVMENFGGEGGQELSFACTLHQLSRPLHNRTFTCQDANGVLQIERCGDYVCADFAPFDDRDRFRHCIHIDTYRAALQALECNVIGYVA